MASNPKDPMSRFFEKDIVNGKRSNFNWSYKNRLSADFGYLYPVGLWDVPADVHFELDLKGFLSSNPTLAPILGKVKFRVEAYFIEKAAYVPTLRNNDRVPVDRNVSFPIFGSPTSTIFSPRTGLLELLQMYPAGFSGNMFGGEDPNDAFPSVNAIPFIMYYDIYRNFYINPQDDAIPLRVKGFVPSSGDDVDLGQQIKDEVLTRSMFDDFINSIHVANTLPVNSLFFSSFGVRPYPTFRKDQEIKYPSARDHENYRHYGLLRRTLNNDFFTSFVSNDNVDIMTSHSNVRVSNNIFSVEQIQLANRNWRIATRSLLWGTDWKDYNKVHYGVNLMIPYGRPQFLGALSSDVTFSDVISQAQTGQQDSGVSTNVNLGSRAGLAFGGLGHDKDKHFVEFNTKDEGYVMVLASIVPEVDYYQGIDPMYFKTNLQHSWMQEYNSVGMQDFHRAWATAVVEPASYTTFGWSGWNVAEHQVPIWFEYMAKYNQLHGDFTSENHLRYWTFARPFTRINRLFPGVFEPLDEPFDEEVNMSTYVLPEMFNYVFANNIGADNFQMQFNFSCKVSSMLDKQVIAYL